MRTNIVYAGPAGRLYRANLLRRADEPCAACKEQRGSCPYGGAHARLVDAHEERWHRLGESEEHTTHMPDAVMIRGDRWRFRPGQRAVANVRLISDRHVLLLETIDEKIADLQKQRKAIVAEAFAEGRPVRKADFLEGE